MADIVRHHRDDALALLNAHSGLTHKEAGFLGHICVASKLTPKQRQWLDILLARYGLACFP